MRTRRRRLLAIPFALATVATAILVGATPVPGDPAASDAIPAPIPQDVVRASGQRIPFDSGDYVNSAVCGTCHLDIYSAWRGSVHAGAFRDPLFQAGLAQAIALEGTEAITLCLTCHAPASVMMNTRDARDLAVLEGIGFHFCHVLKGRDTSEFPPFELDRELTMYGPLADAQSTAHDVAFSPFLDSAEYCASCHEYTNPNGAKILSTFTEYGAGTYSQSLVACQDCHMPLVPGRTVDPSIKDTGRTEFVDYHSIPGGRDIWQLRRAVSVDIVDLEQGSGSVTVTVAVESRAAGHWLPTGMPSRWMVLEVGTSWGEHSQARSIDFGRKIVDADGNRLTGLASMILRGDHVTNDTRLRPRQRREFSFTLPAPSGQATTLSVRLFYESSEVQLAPEATEDIVRIERSL